MWFIVRKLFGWQSKRTPMRRGRSMRSLSRLGLEVLEDRLAPAVYTVSNTDDAGAGSLRQAITAANANPGANSITFNIQGAGVKTINLQSDLPFITNALTINGYTQPGAAPNNQQVGDNATLLIVLDGASTAMAGLSIASSNVTVKGLVIENCAIDGIVVAAGSNVTISGNFIGTDNTGAVKAGNGADGVSTTGAANVTIGGNNLADRNIISGNTRNGVNITGDGGINSISVQGNYIGTDNTGTKKLDNGGDGVLITDSSGNEIGGTAVGAGNVISGNTANGIHITGTSLVNQVSQNYIGTMANGLTKLGNTGSGVLLDSLDGNAPTNNDIGVAAALGGNVISGNLTGVTFTGEANANTVQHNYIGTDKNGTGAIPNGIGVDLGNKANTIGGSGALSGNVISGNTSNGIEVESDTNIIQGNYIGTDWMGNTALPNGASGILVKSGTDNQIGGPNVGEGNVISGNGDPNGGNPRNGIQVTGGTGTVIKGNYIGTDWTGTEKVANQQDGVSVEGVATNTRIGGANAADGNVISGNAGDGVFQGGVGTTLQNNTIGRDGALLNQPLPNGGVGVRMASAGGLLQQNTIASNGGDGVVVTASSSIITENSIFGNNGNGIYTGSQYGSPVLISAVSSGNTITIQGTLTSTPDSSFTLEFFGNQEDASPGYEQGEQFLGTITVTTDDNGDASFDPTFNTVFGNYVSATATGNAANGYTSQFSAYVPIVQDTSINLSSSANPAQDGDPVTLTAAVTGNISGGGTPTGSITFLANGNVLGTATLDETGTASLTTSSLADGGNDIIAVYSGDSTYPAGTSTDLIQVVQPSNGGITLTASATSATYGQPITLMATVSGPGGTPTGDITFMDGDTVLGDATLDGNGLATLTTTALTGGDNTITAVYSGDANFAPGTSSPLAVSVSTAATTTVLTSSLNTAAAAAEVTFTVAVSSDVGLPTGTVSFYDGDTLLDTETLNNVSTASFTTADLALGSHTITAVYSGDGNFASSTSTALTETITSGLDSSTTLVSSADSPVFASSVTFTATVTGSGATPTGTVSFYDGSTLLDTETLDANATGSFTTTTLIAGTHSITAVYSGDATYGSSSSTLTQTIVQAAPALTVEDDGGVYDGVDYEAWATIAGVVPGLDDSPSDSLEDVGLTLDYQQLDANGNVIADLGATAPTQAGSYLVTVSFAGSTDYAAASTSTTFTISQATPTLTVTDVGGTFNGQAFPATVLVAGVVAGVDDTPSASLEGVTPSEDYQQVDSSGDVLADLGSTAPTSAGTYQVIATFAGSTDYASVSVSTTFTITQATPTLTVSDAGGTFNGQAFVATALVAGVVAGVDDAPSASLEGVTPTEDYQQVDSSGDVLADLGSSAPTSAGTYQVSASFAGSTDYTSVSASTTFTIAQATPTLTVTDDGGTFNGQQFAATVLVAGVVAGVDDTLSASLEGVTPTEDYQQLDSSGNVLAELGSTAPTSAGTYQVIATFAGSTDYASVSASTTFTIAQANPSVALDALDSTYNGQPFAALGLVEGVVPGVDQPFSTSLEGVAPTLDFQQVDSNDQTIADLGSAAPVQAGSYLVIASFPGSTDYASATNCASSPSARPRPPCP